MKGSRPREIRPAHSAAARYGLCALLLIPSWYERVPYFVPLAILALTIVILLIDSILRHRVSERDLRTREAHYRGIVEDQLELVCRTDAAGRIVYANHAFCEALRSERSEISGKKFSAYVLEEDRGGIVTLLNRLTPARPTADTLYRIPVPRSTPQWHHATLRATFDGNESFSGALIVARDVTERMKEQERLRFLARAVDSTGEMISITDLQDRFIFLNQAFLQTYGYDRDELLGKTPAMLLSQENPKDTLRRVSHATRTGGWRGELINRRKDGSEFTVALNTAQVCDGAGNVVGLIGVARDISERKKSEALQRAVYRVARASQSAHDLDEFFRTVHEIVRDVMPAENFFIALHDEKNNLLTFPYHADPSGLKFRARPLGRGVAEYVLKTGKPLLCTPEVFHRLKAEGKAEYAGKPVPAVWLGVPLKASRGTIGVMAVQHQSHPEAYGEEELRIMEFVSSEVAREIERLRDAERLTANELRFRSLIERSSDVIGLLDAEGRFMYVGPSIRQVLGFTPEEMLGKDAFDLMHPDDLTRGRKILSHVRSTPGAFGNGEIRFRDAKGSYCWIEGVATNLLHVDAVSAIVVNFRNISERREAEEERRRIPRRIIEAQESERRRVARELHDGVNQILSAVRMAVGEKGGRKSGAAVDAERVRSLLDRAIREVRRISHNLRPSELDDLGLRPALRSMCDEMEARTGIGTTLRMGRGLAALGSDVELAVYRIAQEALNNIERHAKATRLLVTVTRRGRILRMTVVDNGGGMNRKEGTAGGGMGLLNMRERAAAFGGTVAVTRRAKGGTELIAVLPLPEQDQTKR